MRLRSRTIANLSRPFEGGMGPTHGSIDRIWLGADASEYLPNEGNKAERVRGGLMALKNGAKDSPYGPLPPDPEKLARVAEDLAATLVSGGHVSEEAVAEALEAADDFRATDADESPVSRDSKSPSAASRKREPLDPSDAPIFVVHGHDTAVLHQVVRVLERATSRDVIVLHEQPNRGSTVIEKFERHAEAAAHAVVMLTADDTGGAVGDPSQPRSRQNVIFELGFFFGNLGREHVSVLLAEGVEQPSDIAGLVYIAIDKGGAWKYELARELQAAGIAVSFESIP